MSLDVYLEAPTGEVLYSRNITHNLNKMADAAGIYKALWRPEEIDAVYAKDISAIVDEGLIKLVLNPTEYRKYDSPNGWGMYDHFVPFVMAYAEALRNNPDAVIRVGR